MRVSDPHCGWVQPHSWIPVLNWISWNRLSTECGWGWPALRVEFIRTTLGFFLNFYWKFSKYWVRVKWPALRMISVLNFTSENDQVLSAGQATRSADGCIRIQSVFNPKTQIKPSLSLSSLFSPFSSDFHPRERKRAWELSVSFRLPIVTRNRVWNRVSSRGSLRTLLFGISFSPSFFRNLEFSRFLRLSF